MKDDPDTSTVQDSTTNNNDGTKRAAANPLEVDAQIAKGQDFERDNADYIDMGDTASLDITGSISIEFWAKLETQVSVEGMVMKHDDSSDRAYGVWISASEIAFQFSSDGTGDNIWSRYYAFDETGVMRYWVVTFVPNGASSVMKGYRDGEEITLSTPAGGSGFDGTSIYNSSQPFRIGNKSNGGWAADAVMDEVRISGSIRNDAWIKASYNSGADSLLTYGSEETASQSYQKTFSETLTLSDSIIKKPKKILSEIFTLSDSIIKGAGKILSETLSLTDSIIKGAGKVLSETFNITDIFTRIGVFVRTLTETFSITDTIVKGAKKIFSEVFNITDTITAAKKTIKTLTETFNITEIFSRGVQYIRTLTETINITDIIQKGIKRVLSETYSIIESFTKGKATQKILSEIFTITDTISKGTKQILSETITITDSIIKGLKKVFTETFSITDSIVKTITRLSEKGWAKAKGVFYPPAKGQSYPSGKSQY